MTIEDRISSLSGEKNHLKTYLIPKLVELKNQLDDCQDKLFDCYRINDSSADKNKLSEISAEVSSMINSANNSIKSINSKIDSLNDELKKQNQEKSAANNTNSTPANNNVNTNNSNNNNSSSGVEHGKNRYGYNQDRRLI